MPRYTAPLEFLSHRQRYAEILAVVSRHGLGWLANQLGLSTLIPLGRRRPRRAPARPEITQAEHVRLALEELGTTFIKLGQILSTREDLLPPEYIAELSKLQDQVPPFPVDDIIAVIEKSFAKPLDELYAAFDRKPLAAASIGQVHRARLHSGVDVVVKAQKPGVARQVEEDLEILDQLARFAQPRAPLAESYDLVAMVDEFAWTLRSELDYVREGRNADRFRQNFSGNPAVLFPIVYWERTTHDVITLQYVEGIQIDDIEALDAAGIDRKALAVRAARLTLDEVFVHRFYHADPHAGNFVVLPDGKIGAFDFGMVGRLDNRTRDALLMLIDGVIGQDSAEIVDALAFLRVLRHGIDQTALQRDVEHLVDHYYGLSLEEFRFDVAVNDVMSVIRRRQLQLPAELTLLLKTLTMQEGLGRRLDPDFRPTEVAAPYLRRARLERYLPRQWVPELLDSADDSARLLLHLPRRADRLLTRVEQGDLEVAMRVVALEDTMHRAQQMVNRVVVAILVSASLISLGLVMVFYHPDWLVSWLGPLMIVGIAFTFVVGVALGWRIYRSGNRGS